VDVAPEIQDSQEKNDAEFRLFVSELINTMKSPRASKPRVTTGATEMKGNFIREIIREDLKTGRIERVVVRFPPEPNGFLHIGHSKAIALNFGLARDFDGIFHLRFDDTNPETEDMKFVEAIEQDLAWLGVSWGEHKHFASDYYEQLYDWSRQLIKKGKAYVDDLNEEEIRAHRGTVSEPGTPSPWRRRSIRENLTLFEEMRSGAFADGEKVLRAKIDLTSPNMKMRDPLMYRIRHKRHYRRGEDWCIYPMYDWAHGQSDAIEGISHSICTLEFENNRELYDWFLKALDLDPRPRQLEFARLNITYMVMSKRKLLQLVDGGFVEGWDDPRMPTIAGLRRRGVTPGAILAFSEAVGVTRVDSRVDIEMFEHAIRDDLNCQAPRVMCVVRPLKVVISNLDKDEWLEAPYWPHDVPREGSRNVPLTREIYIERDDFMENPPPNFHRLALGTEVRLRYAYIIRCNEVKKDENGEVVELRCSYDPETRSGGPKANRRVKGTVHWVSATHGLPATVRLYDRLFDVPNPSDSDEDFKTYLNPHSVDEVTTSVVEPSVKEDPVGTRYQFERIGYFWPDPKDSKPDRLVFNRIISLRDKWSKLNAISAPVEVKLKRKSENYSHSGSSLEAKTDPVDLLGTVQRARYEAYLSMDVKRDEAVVIAGNDELIQFFEDAVAAYSSPPLIARWIVNELLGAQRARKQTVLPFAPEDFAHLVAMVDDGDLSGRMAKDVLAKMLESGRAPEDIVAEEGLAQLSDESSISALVEEVVNSHPDKVAAYQAGKRGLMGFFVGRVMQASEGKANPEMASELLETMLDG